MSLALLDFALSVAWAEAGGQLEELFRIFSWKGNPCHDYKSFCCINSPVASPIPCRKDRLQVPELSWSTGKNSAPTGLGWGSSLQGGGCSQGFPDIPRVRKCLPPPPLALFLNPVFLLYQRWGGFWGFLSTTLSLNAFALKKPHRSSYSSEKSMSKHTWSIKQQMYNKLTAGLGTSIFFNSITSIFPT